MWTQNDVKLQKWNISEDCFCIELKLCTVVNTLITKFYDMCDISIATQWAPGPLHSKGEIGVFLLQEVLFLVVHSEGVSKYGHYTAQAHESPLNSGATNRAFLTLGR